jgi:hypothetical protein
VTGYEEQVRAYLAYCAAAGAWMEAQGSGLDPKYHPTEAGACKLIPHDGDPGEARKIRHAYAELAGAGDG